MSFRNQYVNKMTKHQKNNSRIKKVGKIINKK